MFKKNIIFLCIFLFLVKFQPANAFGPAFNINFGGEKTTVSGFGLMNGNNSQGSLPLITKQFDNGNDKIEYAQIAKGIYVIVVKNKNNTFEIEPYISEGLETNFSVFKKEKPYISINAGYFDPKNQKTTSFIVKNTEVIANPKLNENLTENEKLKPYLDTIYNRSEFRILQKNGKIKYDITNHNNLPAQDWEIKHSVQAGPMLYPNLTAEEECFVAYENGKLTRDAISVTHKAARTALGIKNDSLYIIIATVENPLTLYEMSKICRYLNLEKAINFDGGGSTSFDSAKLHIVSEKDAKARKLKSFLLIKQAH